ncbi:MAG: hypothetical protein ACOYT4_00480 [Nanoarchaeota archaeon]
MLSGQFGYESEIPKEIKGKNIWVKCMNSPIWIRKNIGNPNKNPGMPYQDPKKFSKWAKTTIGNPKEIDFIALIGLTLDCCVSFAAQELTWRGYKVKILKQATDTFIYSGIKEKEIILSTIKANHWADIIEWKDLKNLCKKNF